MGGWHQTWLGIAMGALIAAAAGIPRLAILIGGLCLLAVVLGHTWFTSWRQRRAHGRVIRVGRVTQTATSTTIKWRDGTQDVTVRPPTGHATGTGIGPTVTATPNLRGRAMRIWRHLRP